MNDRLQPGDYVTGLTKEQFDEIMELQPSNYLKYDFIEGFDNSLVMTNGYIGIKEYFRRFLREKLPYEEFLRRAKNTFQ